jgi:hypothetical protein
VVSNNIVMNLGWVGAGYGAVSSYIPSNQPISHLVPAPVNGQLLFMNNTVKNVFGPAFLVSSAESVQLLNNVAVSANPHPQATNYVYGTATPKEAVVVYGSRDVQICGQTGSIGVDQSGTTQNVRIGGPACASH